MADRLTVVLDEVGERSPTVVGRYSSAMTAALIETAPEGMDVAAIAAKLSDARAARVEARLPGLAELRRTAVPSRELREAWLHSFTTIPVRGLVHATSLMAPLRRDPDRGDQVTVTVHGLQSFSDRSKRKQQWFERALRRALQLADGIVVPTTAVAEDLALLHDVGERVRVVHPAPSASLLEAAARVEPRARLSLPDEYVLAITSPGSRGDALRLVETVASDAMPDVRVVVAGPVEWGETRLAGLAVEAGIPAGRLVMVGELDDARLAIAHRRALAHLHVAEQDALGLTLLDAAALGTPTVHPASRSLSEISGGASVAAAGGAAGLAAALGALLEDDDERARLRLAAQDRANAFTWAAAAREVWRLHAEL
ncbi:glycosyltransferase [Agrococcus sp. TF02-05]|uniref:glycosyltransferase family protein n=1 Tax=Agrococcus sp. TF02-05 TaxID=2815211 RepID=UPI001AA18CA9|nr:glycosyltransferase [Agrococcus sp. TF02-05]MBO1770690.1 glycosyltransferase [Agrococcus sp. TF02-05]